MIPALNQTYHTSSERGQRRASSGDDEDNDKYAHKYTNTKSNTKKRTKYRKDQVCATFSKSRECKDIKYDILSASSEHHTK